MIPAALLISAAASAAPMYGPYAGISGTLAFPNYDDAKNPKGYQAFAGYQFGNPLFLEASYLDTGKADIDAYDGASQDTSLKYKGASVGIGLAQVSRDEQVRLWVLGNYYDGKSTLNYPAGSIPGDPLRTERFKEDASGASLAFGGDFNVGDFVGMRVRIERMFDVKDSASDEDLMIASVGVYLSFPVYDRGERYISQVRAVPLHEGAVSPELVAVPSCPMGPANVVNAQQLRNQPKSSSTSEGAVPSGSQVEVIDSIGGWCLVRHQSTTGWIAAGELTKAP
jgi:hypothetical protein